MAKSNTNIIIIDDEPELSEHELIFELKLLYEKVEIFAKPKDGIEYIKKHLTEKNIIILDYKFDSYANGSHILEAIRSESKVIPVILWTANADKIHEFVDIVNNRIFAILHKSPYDLVLEVIKDAEYKIDTSIEGALEEWISIQNDEDLDSPYFITANGKQYTLNDLLREIRLQTPFGTQVQKDLLMLTIDLLLRNKEQLP
jgi:DNA-binding NtrC family response regulator